MCTVSVIPLDPTGEAIRLVCNRDELRSRPAALPPQLRTFGNRRAILPIDPVSDGAWVAASDAGLVFTLLNHHPRPAAPAPPGAISRGRIIPQLLHLASFDDAVASALRLRGEYQPFRLVILDRAGWCEIVSDGDGLRTTRQLCERAPVPILFTSSGLGDELVESPRRELFEQMVPPAFPTPAAQDAFHAHTWPGREHVSVCMSRPDARTVSITTIEISSDRISLSYEPIDDATAANARARRPCHVLTLNLQPAAAR